jgi:hypothetical protein
MRRRMVPCFLLLVLTFPGAASAGVNVNINIGTQPPRLVIASPPALAVIPGTYVYVAPDLSAEMIFYQDSWYRPHAGRWYVSGSYNGPWKIVASPPPAIVGLPGNYRSLPPGHTRMPYGQVKENWRSWERDRHWAREAKQDDRSEEREHHRRNKREKRHDDDHDRDRGSDRKHHGD